MGDGLAISAEGVLRFCGRQLCHFALIHLFRLFYPKTYADQSWTSAGFVKKCSVSHTYGSPERLGQDFRLLDLRTVHL